MTRDERRSSMPLGLLLLRDEAKYLDIAIDANRQLVSVTSVNAQGDQVARYTPEQLDVETRNHAELACSIFDGVALHEGPGVLSWDLDGLRDARDLSPTSDEPTHD